MKWKKTDFSSADYSYKNMLQTQNKPKLYKPLPVEVEM